MLWEIVLFFAGFLSLGYYVCICILLGKWDATFSRFWLAAGILLPVFSVLHKKEVIPLIFRQGIAAALLLTAGTLIRIAAGMFSSGRTDYEYLIVLGAQVRGTKITDSLLRRLKKACAYLKEHPDTKVIVSGGRGKGEEIEEARAMEAYLLDCGIEKTRIIKELRSRTTKENLLFSAAYLEKEKTVTGIVSNNFHLYRACRYARKLGYKKVYPVCAGCHPVLFVNYMMREVFAVWKMWC